MHLKPSVFLGVPQTLRQQVNTPTADPELSWSLLPADGLEQSGPGGFTVTVLTVYSLSSDMRVSRAGEHSNNLVQTHLLVMVKVRLAG